MHTHSRDRFKLSRSRSGAWTLRYASLWLHSQYNPVQEGERLANRLSIQDGDCLIVLGVGLGYHMQQFLSSAYQDLLILAIDFHPYSSELLKEAGLREQFEHVHFYSGSPDDCTKWLSQAIPESSSPNIKVLEHPPSIHIAKEYYQSIQHSIQKIQKYKLQSYFTTLICSRRWHENTLKNIPVIQQSTQILRDQLDLPILIIGSGASLNESLEEIPRIRDRVILLALGPVLNCLLDMGIEPDITITVEGGIANRMHFYKPYYALRNTVLISPLLVHPYVLRRWYGYFAVMQYTDFPLDEFLLSGHIALPMQANVALTAFYIAALLSSGDVFFVGLDFAFIQESYHFRANALETCLRYQVDRLNPFEKRIHKLLRQFHTHSTQSYTGAPLTSNSALELYRSAMESLIQSSKRRVYTLNKNSAQIHKVIPESFKKLLKYKAHKFKITDILHKTSQAQWQSTQRKTQELLTSYKEIQTHIHKNKSFQDYFDSQENPAIEKIIRFAESRLFERKRGGVFEEHQESLETHITKDIKLMERTIGSVYSGRNPRPRSKYSP